MLYISGIFALNLPCQLDTCGDWHQSSLDWQKLRLYESERSFFKEYGIERGHSVPEHTGLFCVANTIRACLDLLLESKFDIAQGMNEDFIGNDKYDIEIFKRVYEMRILNNFRYINDFMEREYRMKWINYKMEISKKNNLMEDLYA